MDFLIEKDRETLSEGSSAEWVDMIDCGGLVYITEECHQLFISIEYVTRYHMNLSNLHSMDEDFQEHLERVVSTDDDVLLNWTMTGSNDEELLQEIIKLWVTIRGFSFAKSIMEKYKQESKKSTKKSKGLLT